MTDHKFTDEEVIKALESKAEAHCAVCDIKGIVPCEHCIFHYIKHAVHLINRQKAEIEELKKDRYLVMPDGRIELVPRTDMEKIKGKGIKEFAERLCEGRVSNDPVVIAARCLLKEITEEKT